ncbi:MAG TPA: hypothetical protein VMJ75_12295 [Candidatus Acidoferrales bacterium]|nr:hypothetical protein [Candidatus Acidoferrales bacterium]
MPVGKHIGFNDEVIADHTFDGEPATIDFGPNVLHDDTDTPIHGRQPGLVNMFDGLPRFFELHMRGHLLIDGT